ncbi:MAG: hypothetical protein GYA24_14550 [Candidatus Lokiarchaeota archaeon]|nr:hypothetical protein [Candidatus Lokiarchaeota archaeon]
MSLGTIVTLRESEFFTFFNIHEVSRQETGRKGVRAMQCKPGGFQEHIDISFEMDANENVVSARLVLDRSWIGNPDHVNPFANDIAKSFIDTLVPAVDHGAIEPLLATIMNAKGIGDKRIYLHDQPRDLNPNFDTIKALGVYLQVIGKHEIMLSSCMLRMENIVAGGRVRLEIEVLPR